MASPGHPSLLPSPIPDLPDDGSISSEDILTGEGRSAPPPGVSSRPYEETRMISRPQGSPSMASRGRSVQERTITTTSAPPSSATCRRTSALLQQQRLQGQQIVTPLPASQQCSSGSGIQEVKDKECKDNGRGLGVLILLVLASPVRAEEGLPGYCSQENLPAGSPPDHLLAGGIWSEG